MEQVIQLATDDDIVAIRARLEWTEARQVLLLVPPQNVALRSLVNLKILARLAQSRNIELALVSRNLQLRDLAREAGIRVFAAEWLARRAGFVSLQAPRATEEETEPPKLRLVDTSVPPRMRIQDRKLVLVVGSGQVGFWQQVIALVLVGILSLAVVIIALAVMPTATVVLTPQVSTLNNEIIVTADPDPAITGIDRENRVVPARAVQAELTIFDQVETVDVEVAPVGRASGTVVVFNRTQSQQIVPISTTVRTSSGVAVEFVTTRPITVPAGTGATATGPIIAVEPGPAGNVPASQINRFSDPTLGLLVRVINDQPTAGGSVELAGVVTEDDKVRLRAKLRQVIQQQGYEQLLADLDDDEFIPPESLQVIELALSYNRFSGDVAPDLGGEMRAVVRATVVDSFTVNQLAYFDLLQQVPGDQILLPDDLRFQAGGVTEVNDRAVTFPVTGEGMVVYEIDRDLVRERIAGRPIGEAQSWLSDNMPIVSVPGVEVEPNWLGRVPFFPFRIEVIVNDMTQLVAEDRS